jgi:hypothetical protein
MRQIKFMLRQATILTLFTLLMTGINCGDSDKSTSNTGRSYGGTQAPGDYHKYSLYNDGTWEATNLTLDTHYSGTYVSLPSGFLKLTVTASTDPTVILPFDCYACELPNTALLVQADPDQEIIVCSYLDGTLSPGTYQYWGVYNPKSDDPETLDNEGWTMNTKAFGKWSVTVGADMKVSVEETSMTWENAIGPQIWEDTEIHEYFVGDAEGTYTMENSIDQVRVATNPSGAFIIDFDATSIGIAGAFGGPETPLSWTDDVLTGDYIGFLFRSTVEEEGSDPMVFPVWASAGTGEDSSVTDMWDDNSLYGGIFQDDNPEESAETFDNGDPSDGVGSDDRNGVRFNGLDAETPFGDGLFKVKDESDPSNPESEDFFFAVFIDPVSGKKIVYGIGSNDEGHAYNVLLFEK